MDIRVKRGKEHRKGGMLSGQNVKLTFEVDVRLTEEEKELVRRYSDPSLDYLSVALEPIKVDQVKSNLSEYRLVVHVDDGYRYLGEMLELEKTVLGHLLSSLGDLKALDAWEGEQTFTSEGES